mgnify:CR=1 FL=1
MKKLSKITNRTLTDDLNCRRTSFLLLHNLITSSEDLTKLDLPLQNEFRDLKSRHKELNAKDQALYSLLFGDNISYQSTDELLKAWKEAGLKFPENVKLLSVFQNSPGDVSNFHTAIAYEKDGSIYILKNKIQHFLTAGVVSTIGSTSKHTG